MWSFIASKVMSRDTTGHVSRLPCTRCRLRSRPHHQHCPPPLHRSPARAHVCAHCALAGRTGLDPPLPWYVLQIMDALWMGCLALSTSMAVPEPPMRITRTVMKWGDEFDADDEECAHLKKVGHQDLGEKN